MAIGRVRVYWRGRVVEQHEVHIGGIIQFAGAELAHAEHREPAAACRIRRIGQAQLARVVRGAQQMRHGERQRGLREVAQRRGDALERPDAADVGDRGRQRDDPLGATHRGGNPVAAGGRRDRCQVGHRRRHDRVRTGGDERAQRGCLAHREIGEVGAVAAESAQQRGHRRPGCQPGLGAAELGKALDEPFRGTGVMRAWPSCVGRRNCVSVMRVKAGREASSRSSGDRCRHGGAPACAPWRSRWRC